MIELVGQEQIVANRRADREQKKKQMLTASKLKK
jgi:hypothetical protein